MKNLSSPALITSLSFTAWEKIYPENTQAGNRSLFSRIFLHFRPVRKEFSIMIMSSMTRSTATRGKNPGSMYKIAIAKQKFHALSTITLQKIAHFTSFFSFTPQFCFRIASSVTAQSPASMSWGSKTEKNGTIKSKIFPEAYLTGKNSCQHCQWRYISELWC